MNGFAGSLVGFGSNVLGGLITSVGSRSAAKAAFNYNKELIQMQQSWQERMSNTAHQREVKDLRSAGLNPILSATGGSGASFGSASAPGMSVDSPDFGDLGVSTALQIRQQKNQNKITDSQTALNDEIKRKTGAEWSLLIEQEKNAYETGLNIMAEREQIKANTAKSIAETERQLIENKYYDQYLRSQIESNVSSASYNRRRSSGYNYNYRVGPVSYSYSGDKQDTSIFTPYSSSAKGWHDEYETISGKKVKVRVRN